MYIGDQKKKKMSEFEPHVVIIGLTIVFGPIIWFVWWCNKDQPKVKTDFGFDKPDKMLSWEGGLYILWNWKSYLAKTVWLGAIPYVWYSDGLGSAFVWFMFGGILVLMGKFWELIKR